MNYRVAVSHLGTNTIQQLYLNMSISCLYCTNYRVAVGHLGTNAIQQLYLNIPISGPYCFNYRVAVGHLRTNTILQLNLSMPISGLYCINYRIAVVGDIAIHSLSNLVQKASVLIPNKRIMVSSCILILLKAYGLLSQIINSVWLKTMLLEKDK